MRQRGDQAPVTEVPVRQVCSSQVRQGATEDRSETVRLVS